uniref:Uncharacterized protein n=1 Tax=Leersia perrieri TaxID=77586 RepID=A0A0D9XHI3_9ORYZ
MACVTGRSDLLLGGCLHAGFLSPDRSPLHALTLLPPDSGREPIQWRLTRDFAADKLDTAHYFFSLHVQHSVHDGADAEEANMDGKARRGSCCTAGTQLPPNNLFMEPHLLNEAFKKENNIKTLSDARPVWTSKHTIRCTGTRLDLVRRKKQAMMETLIVKMNQGFCYDMIEQYCEYIVKRLNNLQKQRNSCKARNQVHPDTAGSGNNQPNNG